MLVKAEHPLKADDPIVSTLAGISMLVKAEHPLKADDPIVSTLAGISIWVIRNDSKALPPIVFN